MSTITTNSFVLKFSCPNSVNVPIAVAEFLSRHALEARETQQYADSDTGKLFMRLVAGKQSGGIPIDVVRNAFAQVALDHQMEWSIRVGERSSRVLIMVSLFDHCLVDLLYRWRIGELPMHVTGIVSNHPIEAFAKHDFQGIPFHYLPMSKDTKQAQEQRLLEIIDSTGTDLVVLARYMQVFSRELSAKLSGRAINIHHSFLPGFKGAKPYHQAHAYGVKVMGATAHYVTADLDEGPIIEQDVERISHFDSPESLVRKGRDIERRVLARAIRYHIDDRVFTNGRKTVVFPD